MVSMGEFLAFAALTAVVVLVPGPSVLFTIGRALTVGRREALLTVVGNALGCYVQVVAVAFGIGSVVERSAAVFTVIKLVGAGYLIFLGVQAIRHRRRVTEALRETSVHAAGRSMRDGFVVGFLNPKTIVYFAVALPQFTDPAGGGVRACADVVAGRAFPADGAAVRQRLGLCRGHRPLVVRPLTPAVGTCRRSRRPDDDRPRREPGGVRPQGLGGR
jgi:threonine/homoserine/homoserine lactone efflux protein